MCDIFDFGRYNFKVKALPAWGGDVYYWGGLKTVDLVLVATNVHDKQDQTIRKCFGAKRATIGRGGDNDWVLPDPQRHISTHHAAIEYENGAYFLIDTSTNGVFLNHDEEAVGRDRSLKLSHGDYIHIGGYEILVELEVEQDVVLEPAANISTMGGKPSALDPLDFFDKSEAKPQSTSDAEAANVLYRGAMDQSSALDEYFTPPDIEPESEKLIPDNWAQGQIPDERSENEAAAASRIPENWEQNAKNSQSAIPEKPEQNVVCSAGDECVESVKIEVPSDPDPSCSDDVEPLIETKIETKLSQASTTAARSAAVSTGEYEQLLEALGVKKEAVSPELLDALPTLIGLLTREAISGLIGGLMVRASMKSAFRVDQTMIQPVENNPLKFSASVDEAIENMLLKNDRGYLPALDAVRKGFDDIKVHQMATMAGMQGALQDILHRFDPEMLEARFAGEAKRTLFFSNDPKYWEHYKEFYKEVRKEAMDNFQNLLGTGFTQAYEDQVQMMESIEPGLKKQNN